MSAPLICPECATALTVHAQVILPLDPRGEPDGPLASMTRVECENGHQVGRGTEWFFDPATGARTSLGERLSAIEEGLRAGVA